MKYGRWVVISRAEDHITSKGYHHVMWNCECECGIKKVVRGKSLTSGISKSCGCLQRELVGSRKRTHGGFGTRLYAIWDSMRQRCTNPNSQAYHNYGGRGIKICSDWDDFSVFRDWAYSKGYDETAPRGDFTLDRIDVNGDYSPSNCRFSNMRDQTNNRRETLLAEFEGKQYPLTVISEITGIKYCTLWRRLKRGAPLY